ncbi:MAG TPA: response regulator, partial [Rubrivivax sp.]|nr:response regulator [Rubrivivax sp.]
ARAASGGAARSALPYIAASMKSVGRVLAVLAGGWLAMCCALQPAAAAATQGGAGGTAQVLVITGTDPYLPAFVAIDTAMREAVARRRQEPVQWIHVALADCLVVDLNLPAMSGLDLVERPRERGLDTPTVAISAHDVAPLRQRLRQCGIEHFLAKPFRGSVLVRSVGAALGQRRDGGGP